MSINSSSVITQAFTLDSSNASSVKTQQDRTRAPAGGRARARRPPRPSGARRPTGASQAPQQTRQTYKIRCAPTGIIRCLHADGLERARPRTSQRALLPATLSSYDRSSGRLRRRIGREPARSSSFNRPRPDGEAPNRCAEAERLVLTSGPVPDAHADAQSDATLYRPCRLYETRRGPYDDRLGCRYGSNGPFVRYAS